MVRSAMPAAAVGNPRTQCGNGVFGSTWAGSFTHVNFQQAKSTLKSPRNRFRERFGKALRESVQGIFHGSRRIGLQLGPPSSRFSAVWLTHSLAS